MDVAIVGISMRFPGSDDIHTFWENTRCGRDMIVEIPPERWDWHAWCGNSRDEPNKSVSRWGGYLKDVDKFDALFFRISPAEATRMDPQQRILLEQSWSCLEDAGYPPSSLAGERVGVFVGACNFDYKELLERDAESVEAHTATGTYNTMLSGRISFFHNFLGPSVTLDTACSSSLVALHLACAAIRDQECNLALAGGVSVLATPTSYISFSKAGMLSATGACKTLDAGADGYVRGEGAALVLLKPLDEAIAANDHIYGIIKGSASNHGGRVRTLTSPSAFAQSRVITEACARARVDARTIGYVELHGTGTPLGDPIEVQGLKRAFGHMLKSSTGAGPEAHCALGTVKTHIGHLEAAAGMAGLVNVLMAMQEQTLPPLRNLAALNPKIDLEGSPFYVVTEAAPWPRKVDENGSGLPYRAGLSSYGFGGSNAHVIIEEHIPSEGAPVRRDSDGECVVPLSSTSAADLRRCATNLLGFLQRQHTYRIGDRRRGEIAEVAATLQLRREAMSNRLAFVVRNLGELVRELEAYLADASAKRARRIETPAEPGPGARSGGERATDTLETDGTFEELSSLACKWVAGEKVDWRALYRDGIPRALELPGHPFDRSSYWIRPRASPSRRAQPLESGSSLPAMTRQLAEGAGADAPCTFVVELKGNEPFLVDHQVAGASVLPAAVDVYWVCQAMRSIHGTCGASDPRTIEITDLAWLAPVAGGVPTTVIVELTADGPDRRQFRIFSQSTGSTNRGLHCRGTVGVRPTHLQLAARTRNDDLFSIDLDVAGWYRRLAGAGYAYGKSMQGMELLMRNQYSSEVVARVHNPASVCSSEDEEPLHPALLDSALQSTLALLLDRQAGDALDCSNPLIPVVADQILVDTFCASPAWVNVESAAGDDVYDVALYDSTGRACMGVHGLRFRPVHGAKLPIASSCSESAWTLLPVWDRVARPMFRSPGSPGNGLLIAPATTIVRDAFSAHFASLVNFDLGEDESPAALADRLRGHDFDHVLFCTGPGVVLSTSPVDLERLSTGLYRSMTRLFRLVKAMLLAGKGMRSVRWTILSVRNCGVYGEPLPNPSDAGMHAFMRSVAHEYPHWQIVQADLESLELDTQFAAQLLALPADEYGSVWARRDSQWSRLELLPAEIEKASQQKRCPYRTAGVYVVIGGAGGLGTLWSRYVIEHYQVRVIWIGRRAIDRAIEEKLESLGRLGPRPEYYSADGGDVATVKALLERIKAKHGEIHGVIHSAIVLSDQSLERMEEEQLMGAMRAKAGPGITLAALAESGLSVDFFLVFSSFNAFAAPAGQSNYVAASACIDGLFGWLSQYTRFPCKVMNWGYWGETGIVADEEHRERMHRRGYASVGEKEAMAALEDFLLSDLSQVAFVRASVPLRQLDERIRTTESVRILGPAAPSSISAVARALAPTRDARRRTG